MRKIIREAFMKKHLMALSFTDWYETILVFIVKIVLFGLFSAVDVLIKAISLKFFSYKTLFDQLGVINIHDMNVKKCKTQSFILKAKLQLLA